MQRLSFIALGGIAACLATAAPVLAGGRSAADFPLRVHIFQINNHSHYRDRMVDYVDGEGRADLFQNGTPLGFDFGFRCDDRVMFSPGFETYPARWRKPGRELEILQPVMGKPGAGRVCDLKVAMKDTAYVRHNGMLGEEPSAVFKQWMEKHQYDPEHGMNEPTMSAAPAPAAGTKAPVEPQ